MDKQLADALAYAKEQYEKLTPAQKKKSKRLRNRRDLLQFVWGDELGEVVHSNEQKNKS